MDYLYAKDRIFTVDDYIIHLHKTIYKSSRIYSIINIYNINSSNIICINYSSDYIEDLIIKAFLKKEQIFKLFDLYLSNKMDNILRAVSSIKTQRDIHLLYNNYSDRKGMQLIFRIPNRGRVILGYPFSIEMK